MLLLDPYLIRKYKIRIIKKSNQIKIKYLYFKSIWTPLYNEIIKTLALKLMTIEAQICLLGWLPVYGDGNQYMGLVTNVWGW